MNVFSFTGNLGKDAEQRFTQGGDSIVTFSVAVKAGYGDKAVTTWVRCNIWGKRGESVLPYLTKGAQVGVSGELANREYKDKDGQARYSLEVRVNDVTLLGGKQAESPAPSKKNEEFPPSGNKPKPGFDDLGDDIPF